jgi:hypothetical protein
MLSPNGKGIYRIIFAMSALLTIAFDYWFSIPDFYEKLTDSEAEAVLIFEKMKELMDAEAAIPQAPPFSVEELLAMPPLQPDRLAKVPG